MRTLTARTAEVGGIPIRRVLPQRSLRTVGPWCFADHMGPELITPTRGLDVGPHPHIGLHTATWLFDGAVVHTDSLGSDQLIRPGELNLMTAGHGIVHAEQADRVRSQTLHGVQLWLAQPDSTRDGNPAFAHHGDLATISSGRADATVFLGSWGGVWPDPHPRSPRRSRPGPHGRPDRPRPRRPDSPHCAHPWKRSPPRRCPSSVAGPAPPRSGHGRM